MKKNKKANTVAVAAYPPVIVLPTTTPPEELVQLRAAGYVPVMCDEPEKVILKMPHGSLDGGDMLMAAIHGIVKCGYSSGYEHFVRELQVRMLKREHP